MRSFSSLRASSRASGASTVTAKQNPLPVSVRPTRCASRSSPPFLTSRASIHTRPQLRQRILASCHRSYSCACQSAASRTKTVYIALGGNLGDRVAEIERACRLMDQREIRVKRTSSLYETEPMYVMDQDRFLNGACEVGLYPFSCERGS